VRLEFEWIERELGRDEVEAAIEKKLTKDEVVRMRAMDDPSIIPDIYALAKIAARKQVKPEHWIGELPSWCDGTHPSAGTRPRLPPAKSAPAPTPSMLAVAISRLRAHRARASSPTKD